MSTPRRMLFGSDGWPYLPGDRRFLFNGQDGAGEYAIGEGTIIAGAIAELNAGAPVIQKSGSGWCSQHVKDPLLMPGGLVAYCSGYDGTGYQGGRLTRSSLAAAWTYDSTSAPTIARGGSGEPDELGVSFLTILDEGVAGSKRFKCWYRGTNASGVDTVCYAYSADGIAWTKFGRVINVGSSGSWNDEAILPGAIVKVGTTYSLFAGGRQGTTNPQWEGGLYTFTDPEGAYTANAGNPIVLARFNDSGTSVVPTADVLAGATTVQLADTSPFHVGEPVAVADGDTTAHIGYVASIDSGTQVTLDRAVVGNFTGGGKVFRSFAYNSVIPRSVRQRSAVVYEMAAALFQPVEDLGQPASKLWEASFGLTAPALAGPWNYEYVAGRGPWIPLSGSWHTRSAENPSVIAAP